MKTTLGYCFVKPDGTYMGRGSHLSMVGTRYYWYSVKDIEDASVFTHPHVQLSYTREDGFPKEGVNVVTVTVIRKVELTGYGVPK